MPPDGPLEDCGCTPSHLGSTQSYNDYVCFPNFKEPENDQLCIWKDFSVGRTNVKWQDSANLVGDMTDLLQATAEVQPPNGADTVCFHTPEHASVAWTHLHYFKKSSYAEGMGPDGVPMGADTTYCTDIIDDKSAMAQA